MAETNAQMVLQGNPESGSEAAQARALLQQTSPDPSPAVQNWLGMLALLYGVPFENLVPDSRMLPPESLRFFYLDVNWIESAVDGAMSTGVHSDRDIRFHRVLREKVSKITKEAADKVRSSMRGEVTTGTNPAPVPDKIAAGFLMRSAVVSGWPGMEVAGYPDNNEVEAKKIPLLRMERLSPDVLLVIFAEVPGMVVINEPRESLHFGISTQTAGLRDLQQISADPPAPLVQPGIEKIPKRTADASVININDLRTALAIRVKKPLGSGNFAIEMVDSAGKFRFVKP